MHHQEVISGCTGDRWCWEQAEGLPGVAAWPLSLVLTPSAPTTRWPGPAEAQVPSPGSYPALHGAHTVRLCRPLPAGPTTPEVEHHPSTLSIAPSLQLNLSPSLSSLR